jgi:hypothetical protein
MTAGRASCSRRQSGLWRTRNRAGADRLAGDPWHWRCPQGADEARAAEHGGARIIDFVVSRRGVIYLIDIYAKSEKEDLTDAERREIRKLVAALEAEA